MNHMSPKYEPYVTIKGGYTLFKKEKINIKKYFRKKRLRRRLKKSSKNFFSRKSSKIFPAMYSITIHMIVPALNPPPAFCDHQKTQSSIMDPGRY